MMRKITSIVLTLALFAILLLAACPKQETSGSTTNTGQAPASTGTPSTDSQPEADSPVSFNPDADNLAIGFIGEFRGFQQPCKCASQQLGGFPRLATLMATLRGVLAGGNEPDGLPELGLPETLPGQEVGLVECGNFAWKPLFYPVERAKTHMDVLDKLGCLAIVPGSAELQLDADQARDLFSYSNIPIASCNLTPTEEWFKPRPYVELPGGAYLVGLSTWEPSRDAQPIRTWWELADPVASVEGVLAGLPGSATVLVIAPYQPPDVIEKLASLPVTAVIGHAPDASPDDNGVPVYERPDTKGQHVRFISLDLSADTGRIAATWVSALVEQWPDDEGILAVIEGERDRVKEMLASDYPVDPEGWKKNDWEMKDEFLPPQARQNKPRMYVGAASCAACHTEAHGVWSQSGHAHAFDSLEKLNGTETLDCLGCHTAGLLEFSGYNLLKPEDITKHITCESCHGPGSLHTAAMAKALGGEDVEDFKIDRPVLPDVCLRCHDPYNSPEFDLEAYWDRIKH